jgi:hypothetical protein
MSITEHKCFELDFRHYQGTRLAGTSMQEWHTSSAKDQFGLQAFVGISETPNLMSMPIAMELRTVRGHCLHSTEVEALMHSISIGLHQCIIAKKDNLQFVSRRKRDREGEEDAGGSSIGHQSP